MLDRSGSLLSRLVSSKSPPNTSRLFAVSGDVHLLLQSNRLSHSMIKLTSLSLSFLTGLILASSPVSAQTTYEPYLVTTFVGTPGVVGSDDGTGTDALFASPSQIAVDNADNLYVADTGNHTIRKITPAGVVTTLAGLAGSNGSADGTGSAARFNSPIGITLGANGNLYVGDSDNNLIRKVTMAGVVTTVAGLAGVAGDADVLGARPDSVDRAGWRSPEEISLSRTRLTTPSAK